MSPRTAFVSGTGRLAEILKAHLVDQKKETLKKGWGEPAEWLFCNQKGGPVDIDNLRKRVFYK
jgi:hypothetical protein